MKKRTKATLLDLEVKRLTKSVLKGSCCYNYWAYWYYFLCERYWGYGRPRPRPRPTPTCTSCASKESENTGCSGTYY